MSLNNRLKGAAAERLREAAKTYLFAFDPASIAFCAASLEQALQAALLEMKAVTRPELKRERPSAISLLKKATRIHLLDEASVKAATALFEQRNAVLHRDLQVSRQESLAAIANLATVLMDLGRKTASQA